VIWEELFHYWDYLSATLYKRSASVIHNATLTEFAHARARMVTSIDAAEHLIIDEETYTMRGNEAELTVAIAAINEYEIITNKDELHAFLNFTGYEQMRSLLKEHRLGSLYRKTADRLRAKGELPQVRVSESIAHLFGVPMNLPSSGSCMQIDLYL
jgi:hypothetical protein